MPAAKNTATSTTATTYTPGPITVNGQPTVAAAIAKVMAEIGPIGKDSVNPHQGFRYRGIEAVVNHLNPLLAKHGVVVVPQLQSYENTERPTGRGGTQTLTVIRMGWEIHGPGGDSIYATTLGMALDTSDKAGNKAMTAAYKYLLAQVFAIPFADLDDVDSDDIERASATAADNSAELARIDELASNVGLSREQITAKWREGHNAMTMDTFNALPPATLRTLITSISAFQRKQTAPAEPENTEAPAAGLGEPGGS